METTHPAVTAARRDAEERLAASRRATEGEWTLDDMRLLLGKPPAVPGRHERRRYAALSRRAQTR